MAVKGGEVKLQLDHVLVKVNSASDDFLAKTAFQIEAAAKVNIQSNGQIDTGFLLNSVYTLARAKHTGATTRDATWQNGQYPNRKGELVRRRRQPRQTLGNSRVAVAVGADYAIHQEALKSFLYAAGETVASQVKGTAEKVFKEGLK